jgi:TRAP-type C4-dicarboxylate transport system permease small subunit
VRARLPVILLAVVLFGLLGVSGKYMIDTWRQSTAIMSIHGYIALSLGVFFSLLIGCGLMALLFYSSRRGYDEQPELIVVKDDN